MRLILLHEPHQQIHKEIDAAGHRETGGLLLGWRRTDLGVLVVARATGPGRHPVQTPNRLVLDTQDLQHEVVEAFERSQGEVTYLGDWHLHHELEPRPSPQDRRSVRTLATTPAVAVPAPVLMIVGKAGHQLAWRAWVGTRLDRVPVELQPAPA